jgi:glycosyltransferase involved in cell wall biosynthesis
MKMNGGQLSAFNRGFEDSDGDVIAFLDADDFYENNFLEEMLKIFDVFVDVDHIFCDSLIVNQNSEVQTVKERYRYKNDIHFGKTAVKTFNLYSWTGNSTSMNIFRRGILEKILPFDMEDTFRISADRPIIMGVSLASGGKYYLKKTLVNYRIHGENLYQENSKIKSRYYEYDRRLINEKMFGKLLERVGIEDSYFCTLILEEFLSKPTKNRRETMTYLMMVWSSVEAVFIKLLVSTRILWAFIIQKGTIPIKRVLYDNEKRKNH